MTEQITTYTQGYATLAKRQKAIFDSRPYYALLLYLTSHHKNQRGDAILIFEFNNIKGLVYSQKTTIFVARMKNTPFQ